jgi:hypothetical protein
MGLLLPEEREVKLNKILEEKIATMQNIIDDLQRFKQLYEQSGELMKNKDMEIQGLKTKIGSLEMTKMEDDRMIFELQNDLKRMAEIESRDIDQLRTKIINTMQFVISVGQARLIGGLAIFANQMIRLSFDGNTGALVKAITDTDKEWLPPKLEKKDD